MTATTYQRQNVAMCRCGYSITAKSRRRSHCGERMAEVSAEAVRALREITALEGFPVDGGVREAADWIQSGKASDNVDVGQGALDELVAVAEAAGQEIRRGR